MGHQYVADMPKTARWPAVVSTIMFGDVAAVAAATSEAAIAGMEKAQKDSGLASSFHMLVGIVCAARADDFAKALNEIGFGVSRNPNVCDIVAAFSSAMDQHLVERRGRTDLSEMGQLAAVESLTAMLKKRSASLFAISPKDVHAAAKNLSTQKGFAFLAQDFFARFTSRFLKYHLERELPHHVGVGRFADVNAHREFLTALDLHCRESAMGVHKFAGEWYSKHRFLNDFSLKNATGFVVHAIDKLKLALTLRGSDG